MQTCTIQNAINLFTLLYFFQALTQLHAERIGHGYHILEDPELYQEIIEKEVHLEVNYC